MSADPTIPVRVTDEHWDDMLNILPPQDWRHERGVETFTLCEPITSMDDGTPLYTRFITLYGARWSMLASASTPLGELVARVRALPECACVTDLIPGATR